ISSPTTPNNIPIILFFYKPTTLASNLAFFHSIQPILSTKQSPTSYPTQSTTQTSPLSNHPTKTTKAKPPQTQTKISK
ncbi:hypothetical protein, partial [Bacillus thuringiensis]|uniref:hypothetical protein n=1 Tax=Bacillus thuringiensis TaxID=1428 RepID=UPI001C92BDDB